MLHTLAIEIYKHNHRILPAIMGEDFRINRTLLNNLSTQMSFPSDFLSRYNMEQRKGSSPRKDKRMFLFGSF